MPPLPKYLKKNADELRRIRRRQPRVSFAEVLRQVERVAKREGKSSASGMPCYGGGENTVGSSTRISFRG